MLESKKQLLTGSVLLIVLLGLIAQVAGQAGQNPKPPDADDIVRVNSTLVQTDVMVFDKQGRFVNNLTQADFELRIDGKPQPVQFFERVTAGSANEESQLAAARGLARAPNGKQPASVQLDRGRTVFFYIDDVHLAPGDLFQARKMLSHFVEQDMGQNDLGVITSTSGQIGFLQQLSDNKAVLRAAIERLKPRQLNNTDFQRPQMSEYQALQIDRNDRDLVDYFVEQILREFPLTGRQQAETEVHQRASQRLAMAADVTVRTLAGLENLVRSSTRLSGRKLVFFVSGGFFLDARNSDSYERLQRITSAATRNGVVIYSIDARGLVASLSDASSGAEPDPSGRLERSSMGELSATQDAMNALAKDTGGRTVFNTNALEPGVATALKETSVYYLLAWRPDQDLQASNKFRHIAVTLPSKSGLTVRVHQGFFAVEPAPKKSTASKNKEPAKAVKAPLAELREAITASFPSADLPLAMSLTYANVPDKGMQLTALMQVRTGALAYAPEADKQKASIDISGAVYDDKGKVDAAFTEKVTITAISLEQSRRMDQEFNYTYQAFLQPGLYQVRLGVRDADSGKIATAQEWIEIPNLASPKLLLSSLIAGERIPPPNAGANTDLSIGASVRPGHHFHRDSFIRFLLIVYNAARAVTDSQPDVALQIQILRDQQPVMTAPLKKLSTEGVRLSELPYAADLSLEGLGPGQYLLQVTAIDRVAKTSATQTMRFEIE